VILATVLLSAGTWRVFGHTWDEPEHLAAGMELVDRGRYEYDTEHPPLWARQIAASEAEAFLALILLASVPPILGHAALATLDVAAAATTLFALYWLQSWIVSARWRDAALFGFTTGQAFGTKFSSIPFILLGLVVLAAVRGLFFEGVVALKAHNDAGHMSFLLGHVRSNGWWYFYLVALAVKTPLPLLVTGPIGLG
jgi:hypothetical protein